jgi:signal peptidase I
VQPGLGHLYCGNWRSGLNFFLISKIIELLGISFLLWVPIPKLNILIPLMAYVIFYFYVIRNAVQMVNRMDPSFPLPSFSKWYFLFLILIGVWVGSTFVADEGMRTYLGRAYRIPSDALMPTLLIGDHVMVDKTVYRDSEPQRGDIVIFFYPEDETKTFVKRVIGLPNETIEVIDKSVFINGEKQNDQDFTQHVDPGTLDGKLTPRDNYGPVTVPENSFWVLGDNRDQSLDSRFWGFVQREKITGKVQVIYWSAKSELGLSEIRWDRIGKLTK